MNKVLITDKTSDINNHLKNKDTVIILFHANWCGACQQFVPVWDKVCGNISKSDNDITIGKVESEHFDEIGINDINAFPTFRAYQNGNMVDERVGGVPPEELQAFLVKYLKNNKTKKTKTKTKTKKKSNSSKTKKNKQKGGERQRMGDEPIKIASHHEVKQVNVQKDSKLESINIIKDNINELNKIFAPVRDDIINIIRDEKNKKYYRKNTNKQIDNRIKKMLVQEHKHLFENKLLKFDADNIVNKIAAEINKNKNYYNQIESILKNSISDDDDDIDNFLLIKGIIILYLQYIVEYSEDKSYKNMAMSPYASFSIFKMYMRSLAFKWKSGDLTYDWKNIIKSKTKKGGRKRKTRKRKRNKRKKRKSRRRRR